MTRPRFLRAAACVLAALVASAALGQDAQDPPSGDGDGGAEAADPIVELEAAARRAEGAARAEAFAKLGTALEARARWIDAARAWAEASAAAPTAAHAAGEGRALLAFAEEVLAAEEPGSSIRAAFEDARAALRRAVDLGASDVQVRIGLARCLAADGRTEDQIAALRSAAEDFPDDPAPRRALAFALYHAGRPQEAIPLFRTLSDASPADLNLSLTLAACARAAGEDETALSAAERTIAAHPADRRGWEAVWAVYAPARRWAEATERFAALAAARPEDAVAKYYAGLAASNALRWDEALALLDAAWELDRRMTSARLEAARILLQRKHDRDAAAAHAREVLAADPQNRAAADLLSFVALRRSEDGDHEGAVRELEAVLAARPDDPLVHANLGLEMRWAGRYDDSERRYLRAIELSPGDPVLRNDLGLLHLVRSRDDDARAAFLAGTECDPQFNDNLENLGWMAARDGRRDEALAWYRRAWAAETGRGGDGARHRRVLDDVRFPLPPIGTPR